LHNYLEVVEKPHIFVTISILYLLQTIEKMLVAKEYLEKYGIRPSMQRIAVMQYLLTHRTHPTVEEIYDAVSREIPTLSRTTIYNTLRTLTESGAALSLNIDSSNTRYDGYVAPHAHLMCTRCGRIYDVDLDDKDFVGRNVPRNAATIHDAQLFYKGICDKCNKQST